LIKKLSNWGRWGPQDQIGLMNLHNNQTRLKALNLIKEGNVISCSRPMLYGIRPDTATQNLRLFLETGQGRTANQSTANNSRGNFALERIETVFHGLADTHIDSLAHFFWQNYMYNGYPSSLVSSADGAHKNSIMCLSEGLITKAVLIDVPRLKGVPYMLPLNFAIMPSALDAAVTKFNLTIEPGNVILLRTGFWHYNLVNGAVDPRKGSPGLHPSCMSWLHKRDVSLLGTDTPGDVMPPLYPHITMPTHVIGIVGMGMWIIDNADFEELSNRCADRGRWEFALSVAPLQLSGATGSPVNPLVIF